MHGAWSVSEIFARYCGNTARGYKRYERPHYHLTLPPLASRVDNVAERSKALDLGSSPKGRRFEPCRCQISFAVAVFMLHLGTLQRNDVCCTLLASNAACQLAYRREHSGCGNTASGETMFSLVERPCFHWQHDNLVAVPLSGLQPV